MIFSSSPIGKFTHDNYTASGTPATKTFPSKCYAFTIQNTSSTIGIQLSFDGGTTWFNVAAGTSFSSDIANNLTSYQVQTASSTAAVQCLYGSEA